MDLRLNLWICIGVASLFRLLVIPSAYAKESQWSFEHSERQTSVRSTSTAFSLKSNEFLNLSHTSVSETAQLTFQAPDSIEITGIQLEPTPTGLDVV